MEHQSNLPEPNKPASASLVQSDLTQQPQEHLSPERSIAITPLTYDPAASLGESALFWHKFGFKPVPILPASNEPAVEAEPWFDGLSAEKIVSHWDQHSNHEIGLLPGNDILLLTPNGKKASRALFEIENAHDSLPNMALKSQTAMHYLLALGEGVNAIATVDSGVADSIGVSTGQSLVLLPPSFEVELGLFQADRASKLTVASQSLVDAVCAYNASLVQPVAVVDADVAATMAAPATVNAAFSASVQIEAGKGGEAGDHAAPPASDTTFAAFTAFAGQPSGECEPAMDLTLPPSTPASATQAPSPSLNTQKAAQEAWDDDVFTHKAAENPVVAALMAAGHYVTPLGSGLHELTCPWASEHTGDSDMKTTYAEPHGHNVTGVFECSHQHSENHGTNDLLERLGVEKMAARHKPLIHVAEGELHRVIDAAESVLAGRGSYYQAGGIIVSITTDPSTGDPSIAPANVQELTKALSEAIAFEKFSPRKGWVPCDPPARHTGLLHKLQTFSYLPVLVGVARQPYFRDDGFLVTQPGYDQVSKRFGVFDASQFAIPAHPTKETALGALAMLRDVLSEFRFGGPTDEAAALSATFTATTRPALAHAPLFHAMAAISGSGKSYLCEMIVAFSGPAESLKVSFPPTSEEATKAIMSFLVKNPAVVEFDDMTTDLLPHGIINRMLTADPITDRVLGYSKTVTVSTRSLFLSSGNNVGPLRDMLRRVVIINIDPRCATPTTITYKGNPVDTVRKHRGAYVAAVLTIIQAWKAAGSPRSNVSSIATYGGAWADYCRHPLIWLGLPDPATSLLAQVQHDPDSEALGALLSAWFKEFGSTPTTVRKVIATASFGNEDLHDAIYDFPVVDRGDINPSKLGWLLKKNANRIVGGLAFREAQADGRKAWCVMPVDHR